MQWCLCTGMKLINILNKSKLNVLIKTNTTIIHTTVRDSTCLLSDLNKKGE